MRVVMDADDQVGFLAFTALWGKLPFLELFEILAEKRGCGIGEAAVRAWEEEMRGRGFDLVITSTKANADAQHFWRKMGYVDCGVLTVRNKAAEVLFQRVI
ncbi:MAG: GNAT family N-acetyltransferase [Rhodospirillaceae bacterium]|nr:GNAT family N-acetyltransferase [Rhodospirillaceae bacterium]|tara:strand:- start:675 stop:977 length:303 start_codon:yes stop_codon:yes gene_type:complete